MITYKAKDASGEIINSALSPFSFPAGEAHIKREERRDLETTEIAIIQPSAASIHDDLFHLAMWDDYVYADEGALEYECPKRVLILPYIPGARADRGTPFGLKIYADFINNLQLDQVIVFDPHSEVSVNLINNLTVVHSDELFSQSQVATVLPHYTGIIAPDKGATDRARRIAALAELPLYTATKERNPDTGKLSNFSIDVPKDGRFLIIDDICDGGGTFCGLAEASGLDKLQLDLYVSHGVFSKNAYFNLSKHFGNVYSTNSYLPEETPPNYFYSGSSKIRQAAKFHRFDLIRLLLAHIK